MAYICIFSNKYAFSDLKLGRQLQGNYFSGIYINILQKQLHKDVAGWNAVIDSGEIVLSGLNVDV